MGRWLQWPSDAFILVALPLMAAGLILMNRNLGPWWIGVGLFGASVLLAGAFYAAGYVRMRSSHRGRSVPALLHLAASTLGILIGLSCLWLAVQDLVAGQLSDIAVSVTRQMGILGLAFFALGTLAVLSESR
jgi:hypothetical protein